MIKTYKKIQAGFLAALLLLFPLSYNMPLSAAAQIGSVIFEDDFEDKTDWESFAYSSQKWESYNGGVVKAVKDEETGNVYANIYSGALGSLHKVFDAPLKGTVDLDFDMALESKSGDGLYLFQAPGLQSAQLPRIVEFDYQTNGVIRFKDAYGNFSPVTLEPGLWVKTSLRFDTEQNTFSMHITKPGGEEQTVFENIAMDPRLKNSLYGFCFYYPGRGEGMGAIKLDNLKLSQLILNTGIDEDFDSYNDITEFPADWTTNTEENISVSDGALHLLGEAEIQNVHKPYNVDSLGLSGDIRYPENASENDILTVSVMSGNSVISILNISGDGKINGQTSELLKGGEYFHFDSVINSGNYTINIDGVPTTEGVFTDDISAGISGVIIKTSGNAEWSIDNLKSMPALTDEQMNEIREDLNSVTIEEPTPGNVMSLPKKGINGSTITWKCVPESVIDIETGAVNFPDWNWGLQMLF